MDNKQIHIIGGGTIEPVRNHLALAAPAYGTTARRLEELCRAEMPTMDTVLHLTRMAGGSDIETSDDVEDLTRDLMDDARTKILFFNTAIADYDGAIGNVSPNKHANRLKTADGTATMTLTPVKKIVDLIRNTPNITGIVRKDIFLVAFKTTTGATEEEQYQAGLNLIKRAGANLVLANDAVTRINMIITPEEAAYHVTTDREEVLKGLVQMTNLRSHLTFTRSTIVKGESVPWDSSLVPTTLRTIVDHCIERGAYKRFRGVTAGHFAAKLSGTTFLTSRRKTDFNDMKNVGLVKIETDGPDSVIAYGSKPSVGGQSQRIVFAENPEADCIVHFHCPKTTTSRVPTVSQREFECGSHECGENTSRGLKKFGNLKAVYLDNHGPNIVFSSNVDPNEVIAFINENFDLTKKTGGYAVA